MFTRKTLFTAALLLAGTLALANTARAENLAYQFVCHDGSAETRTGWHDERVSNRAMFDKPKSGEQYWYSRSDCRPNYGIRSCSFVVPSEEGHWGPWTQRKDGISCDKVCLNVRAVDGRINHGVSRYYTDITRYRTTYNTSQILNWTPRSHTSSSNIADTRTLRYNSGVLEGYTFCWDASWGTDFWAALYGAPGSSGRMTEVTFNDTSGRGHVFRAVGYYDRTASW
jgi:hypothetical protein